MCFSATASFTATVFLIPAGIYTSKTAWDKDIRYVPLALIPLAFGIQQGLEGMVWLGFGRNQADWIELGTMGFFFFSHGIWPIWPPLAVFVLEHRPWAKKVLLAMTLLGLLFGLFLYVPFWLYPDWLSVSISHGSIQYQTQLIYDQLFSRDITRLIYLLFVVVPACLSELTQFRVLGGLVALSVVVAEWFFNYAFISVWCFFAALLSLYIAYILYSVVAKPDVEDRLAQ